MRLKVYSVILFLWGSTPLWSQFSVSGNVTSIQGQPVSGAELYLQELSKTAISDENGDYIFEEVPSGTYSMIVFGFDYQIMETSVAVNANLSNNITLQPLTEQLSEVVLTQRRERIFALRKLKRVEGTAIYAGKKSEVVLLDGITGNLAANAPRQVFSQVVGLNIYENGDAGLQLNIGGRGLDPNRTANFNTRQNGYDISADVLGYPESYYTPPAEALSEIQVVRGAASLQYGTQFGGLINFKMKQPNPKKPVEWVSRQTAGSYGLITSFNSIGGTVGDFSYYSFFNYKEGDGWRENSNFNSRNYYAHLGYQISDKTKITGELTLFNYLAKQAGGLTDVQFDLDPNFSNRDRNWFDVDWKVYALKLEHTFSEKTKGSFQFFGLDAQRSAVGFRTNRVSQPDVLEEPRELLVDNFKNWGAEARILTRYKLGGQESILLLGSKYYDASNSQQQGAGTNGNDANFNFANDQFPNFERQAKFEFPNSNLALFGENIFTLDDRWSVTPGFRYEFITTESQGSFRNIVLDLAGNVISDEEIPDNRTFERNFLLLGTGITYTLNDRTEVYGNFSQNYRSVTFNDIRVVNPSFVVDENITDEEGFTADLGIRGSWEQKVTYDMSLFGLQYNERLGEVLFVDSDNSIKRRRGNIGDAFIYGAEMFVDWNLQRSLFETSKNFQWHVFINAAVTQSEYLRSDAIGVEGKEVEFIPDLNLKSGVRFGWKNVTASLQYTYLSEQFTDATNAPRDPNDNQRGIEGAIPAYGVMDLSLAYTYKKWRLEAGVNNVLDESYFTRRATGYPGPGIIPAEPIALYTTLQFKL
ncbi:MAG: TonB-dependent receptor [Bacteroidota bacterium]